MKARKKRKGPGGPLLISLVARVETVVFASITPEVVIVAIRVANIEFFTVTAAAVTSTGDSSSGQRESNNNEKNTKTDVKSCITIP